MTEISERLTLIEQRLSDLEHRKSFKEETAPTSTARVGELDIRAAYRIFLNREPDEGGLQHFLQKSRSESFDFNDLISGVTDCEEYRQKSARQLESVEVYGLKVVVDPEEPEFGRAIARDGVWEPHILQAIRQNLNADDVFVDVGANVGIMSFHAASIVGQGGREFAFEPNQDNVQRFLQGVLLNGFSNVTMFPFAASNAAGIFSMQGHSNTYLVSASVGGRLTQSVRVDDLLQNEPRVNFIKIDIEGHEPFALEGLNEIMAKHKPLVLCEFNPRCLRSNAHTEPLALAERIFQMTNQVELVEKDGSFTPCRSAGHLMDIWHGRNDAVVRAGDLEDGLLHFDLLFRVS
ncbi:FkbM family methyltransferase [Sphingomonas naphthae]|uniref:FkbM family methyltransferase n=1 Tax=Sphingomonas naphthae TaxID=1813468 RepID=A0ABY7TLI0_9SPHN|nr:FkbM family methyltransferase [Sphingomonas naphthae]WCT74029.1 FkbM family methyltransferase [Sphingomonas naphthae]